MHCYCTLLTLGARQKMIGLLGPISVIPGLQRREVGGCFFVFFFSSFGCCILGIWNLWKTFTTRAVEFIWFGACDGVGSCRVG
jgi:hypothetical protein